MNYLSYERSHDISGYNLHTGNGLPIPKFVFSFYECLKGKRLVQEPQFY